MGVVMMKLFGLGLRHELKDRLQTVLPRQFRRVVVFLPRPLLFVWFHHPPVKPASDQRESEFGNLAKILLPQLGLGVGGR